MATKKKAASKAEPKKKIDTTLFTLSKKTGDKIEELSAIPVNQILEAVAGYGGVLTPKFSFKPGEHHFIIMKKRSVKSRGKNIGEIIIKINSYIKFG